MKFSKNGNFSFFELPEKWARVELAFVLHFLHFISSILIFDIRSTTFSVHFSQCDRAKPC